VSGIKKLVIGFVFTGRIGVEEKLFLKLAKKRNIELVMINLSRKMSEDELESKIRTCDLVYNNNSDDFVIESLKTIEELGKKVIDTSKMYYYTEDKWMFYIKCREHHIPTPETILLSNNINMARAELKEFGKWPVIIKRLYGSRGEYVEKAQTIEDALLNVKKFWSKDCDKLPIIAQEFIKSPSYRVTIIDKKVVQTAIKHSTLWKSTGVYAKKIKKFRIDSNLRKILYKIMHIIQINICGVDLLKKGNEWLVLEVNAEPGLDFIQEEHPKLVGLILDFLRRYYHKHKHLK
jgi:RimK family alpha-L-glutamate ligase